MTTTLITKTDLTECFYLEKPKSSIFTSHGLECREYPTMPLMYGFINNQMGIKLRKFIAETYPDEQTHYMNYIKKYNYDEEYIKTYYNLSKHGWGRINAERSLSLSLFHRPSRHTFAKEKYLDFDMENAQPQLLLCFAMKAGLDVDGLKEYCENPKKMRYAIAEHYKLKDIKNEDGFVLTAYEQAKKLPIRMAFGGGLTTWKKEYVNCRCNDMPMVLNLFETLINIRREIVKYNPQIKIDCEKCEDFNKKSEEEKNRSVMGLYAQTWERIIQEYCIAYMCRKYNINHSDIIPSQDGFMPLKDVVLEKKINVAELFEEFNKIVLKEFDLNIKWSMKSFDEAITVKPSDIIPIEITIDDLQKGETKIADLIHIVLKKKMYYETKTLLWYYTDKKNLWVKTKLPNEYLIGTTIQRYIKILLDKTFKELNNNDNEEQQKELKKQIKELNGWYSSVGKSSYVGQVAKYLRVLLADNNFSKCLDRTGGKMVFNDGIFDLKNDEFKRGIETTDYITTCLSINYIDCKTYDEEKMLKLRTILKKILNWNDEHLEYYLSILGFTFCGEPHLEKSIYYFMDGTDNGKGDNGKTFFFDVLGDIFPEYVRHTDPKLIEEKNEKAHKQLAMFDNVRLVYADEGTKKKINDKLLKKIADGLDIENEIMFGTTAILKIMWKMFICSNYLPNIDKEAEAVYNRYKQVQLCSHFDRTGCLEEDDYENLEFIADVRLGDELKKDYVREVVNLILDYAIKYYKHGIPPIPIEFQNAVEKTKIANNEFAKTFYGHFEKCHEGRISIDEIVGVLGYERENVINELKQINIKINKDLKGFVDYKIGDTLFLKKEIKKGGITYFKRKEKVEDKPCGDDDDDE